MSSKLCATVYGWRHLDKATKAWKVMAAYRWVYGVTCTPGSTPSPTFSNEYGKTLTFNLFITVCIS